MSFKDSTGLSIAIAVLCAAVFAFVLMCANGSIDLKTLAQINKENINEASGDAGGYFAPVEDEEDDGLTFKLPLGNGVDEDAIDVSMNYVTKTMTISIEEATDEDISAHPLSGSSTHIDDIVFEGDYDNLYYEITFDEYYDYTIYIEENNYCIELCDPHDLYDYVVIVDPGHGGEDSPGTVWDGVLESDITLDIGNAIMEYKEELASKYRIGLYTTRTQDVYTYLSGRVDMANGMDADLFISIHCNSSGGTYVDNSISGVEALYNETDGTGMSCALANLICDYVSYAVDARNRGSAKGSMVRIIRDSEVPVALCEVGFMSNSYELGMMQTEEYQNKLAKGFYEAIIYAYENGLDAYLPDETGDALGGEASNELVDTENEE